jgi:hypothetical protein
LAIFALVALVVGVASDFTSGGFWGRHALLTGLLASVLVVMLSVAVVNSRSGSCPSNVDAGPILSR